MKRLRRDVLKEEGMIFISSFGMPSGPGDLLFFSFRSTESKVYWRRTYGRRVGEDEWEGDLARENVSEDV